MLCEENCRNSTYNCRNSTYIAALVGHLECLKYAHERGCPLNSHTTWAAAYRGDLECLKYAHEHDCPWHPDTTWIAARYVHVGRNGHLKCLIYIYEYCGDVATWEIANLEKDLENDLEIFSKECREFIESVREDWKAGHNVPGKNIKG